MNAIILTVSFQQSEADPKMFQNTRRRVFNKAFLQNNIIMFGLSLSSMYFDTTLDPPMVE